MSRSMFGKPRYFIKEIDKKDRPSDPIVLDAFNRIWEKMQVDIFLWDEFKTDLPFKTRKISKERTEQAQSIAYQYKQDLQAMCFDEKGKRKKLNRQQIQEIQETGRFTVKSSVGEKYDNVWLLGGLLQRGRKEIKRRLQQRKHSANEHWFLHLPTLLLENNGLSLKATLNNLKGSAAHLIRVFLGRPEYRPRYTDSAIENSLKKARLAYLLDEVQAQPENETIWLYQNQRKLSVLLARPDVVDRLREIVLQLSDTLYEKGDILDGTMLLAVQQHAATLEIDPELPALLGKFHYFYHQLSAENPQFNILLEAELERKDKALIKQYPYRGRYEKWRRLQLDRQMGEIQRQVYRQLAQQLVSQLQKIPEYEQEQYCLIRNLEYAEKYENIKKSALSIKFRRAKLFEFPLIKWSLSALLPEDCLPVKKRRMATDRALWRIYYFLHLGYSALTNNCLKLMRTWLHNPLGIKSILTLSGKEFTGEIWLTDNGCPVGGGQYPTHITLISRRWNVLRKYRSEFEEKPDIGLFPRRVSRWFNWFYCYGLYGLAGTSVVLALRYTGFVLLCAGIVVALLLAPIWAPLYAILSYFFSVLIYDFIGPEVYYHGRKVKPYTSIAPFFSTIVYFFLIKGVLFSIVSLLGILFHVLATPVLNALAISGFFVRTAWDLLMRLLFIYPFARIPGDNFTGIVTRIAGYGMALEVLNPVDESDGMTKYKNWLESYILNEYKPLVMLHLHQPSNKLEKMMTRPYQAIIGEHLYPLQKAIDENIEQYQDLFDKNFYNYHSQLEQQQSEYLAHYVRFSKEDLPEFLKNSEVLLKDYIEKSLFLYMNEGEITAYWLNMGISKNAWSLLNQVLLSRAFSADIFTAMEDCDGSVSVQQNQQSVVKSLITEKDTLSKVTFSIESDTPLPETENNFSFHDNPMWNKLYHPLYLPVEGVNNWAYLQRLHIRALSAK